MRERILAFWQSPAVRKITGNFAWLVGEKALKILLTLAVNVWLARYLGPEQFGTLNYAIAFVGLFGTFTYLGMSGIVVRDLVERPEDRDEILGTVFGLKFAGALLAIVVIETLVWFRVEDGLERVMITILSVGMLFQALTVISFWYESRVEGKYNVLAAATSSVAAAITNGVLIVLGAPLVAFAVVIVGQRLLHTLGLFHFYRIHGLSAARWRFRLRRAKRFLQQSWPLILSAIGSVLYLKIDQVMLGHLAGKSEVGIYAVAVQLSEGWYFIPTALAASLFPKIIEFKRLSEERYRERMQWIYRVMVLAALGVAVPITLVADPMISVLYGPEYEGAVRVLMIHIWACPAIFMAAVLSKWLISEGLLMFSLTRHGFGALANIGMNVLLIPRFGAVGAAVATVVSYTVASYLACFSDRRTFQTGVMMTRALLNPFKGVLARPAARG